MRYQRKILKIDEKNKFIKLQTNQTAIKSTDKIIKYSTNQGNSPVRPKKSVNNCII